MRARHLAAALATAAALLLTGCSSDDNSSDPDPAAPAADTAGDRAAVERAVHAYTNALFSADADTAYGILSARCQDEIPRDEYGVLAQQAKDTYGAVTIQSLTVEELSGDMARVSYGVGVPALDRTDQPWAREDGAWKWDAC